MSMFRVLNETCSKLHLITPALSRATLRRCSFAAVPECWRVWLVMSPWCPLRLITCKHSFTHQPITLSSPPLNLLLKIYVVQLFQVHSTAILVTLCLLRDKWENVGAPQHFYRLNVWYFVRILIIYANLIFKPWGDGNLWDPSSVAQLRWEVAYHIFSIEFNINNPSVPHANRPIYFGL